MSSRMTVYAVLGNRAPSRPAEPPHFGRVVRRPRFATESLFRPDVTVQPGTTNPPISRSCIPPFYSMHASIFPTHYEGMLADARQHDSGSMEAGHELKKCAEIAVPHTHYHQDACSD